MGPEEAQARGLGAARGIAIGIIVSIPLWIIAALVML